MTGILSIRDYVVGVHLGCSPGEREAPQEVRVSFEIRFENLPMACESDHLEDTICYSRLCESVLKTSKLRHYETIEHLSSEIRASLRGLLPGVSLPSVRIHKVRPPVENLAGGVIFELVER